jgi:hypothetical protein
MTWQPKAVEAANERLRALGIHLSDETIAGILRAALPLIEVTPRMDEEGRDAVCQRTSVLPSGDIEVQDDMMPCALKAMLRACASEEKDQ